MKRRPFVAGVLAAVGAGDSSKGSEPTLSTASRSWCTRTLCLVLKTLCKASDMHDKQ